MTAQKEMWKREEVQSKAEDGLGSAFATFEEMTGLTSGCIQPPATGGREQETHFLTWTTCQGRR